MKYKILLFTIIVVGVILRFYQLGINPRSLTWDEVALGYNAYSLGIDGKDEFGHFLPIAYIESFGDYKPPVYSYLDILPIKAFGLTPFAVRFPSALLGSLTVLVTYFLVKRIFYSSKQKVLYALVSAGVLAFSPWHIMLSRAAFEANVATFFLITGVWAFLSAIQDKKWLLSVSAVSFVISLYTFNSSRIVAPILVGVLVIVFHKILWKMKKQALVSAVIGVILVAPLIPFMLSPQAKVRYQEVNIFTDPKLIENRNQEIANDDNSVISRIIHNHRAVYGLAYVQHYLDHFNPGYLFTKGDVNPKFSIQDVGQMYLFDLPFLLLGILFLFRKKEGYWWIIPLWLLIGLIPAGAARETPHALRTEAALPTYQILVGYGLISAAFLLEKSTHKRIVKNAVYGFMAIFFLGSVFYSQYQYFQHYPWRFSADWQDGYKESIAYVSEHKDRYTQIYDSGSMGRPYIYYLFYTKTDPREFRKTMKVTRDVFGFVDVLSFGKYNFPKDFSHVEKDKSSLYVDRAESVPTDGKKLKEIKRIDGKTGLVIYTY
jgi:4-amino-4-deoxy-L-arabinose transferase-like glycosyltransferase